MQAAPFAPAATTDSDDLCTLVPRVEILAAKRSEQHGSLTVDRREIGTYAIGQVLKNVRGVGRLVRLSAVTVGA